jgi:hypothetical protein
MHTEILKHKWSYLILIVGLVILMLGFMAVWPDRFLQRLLVLAIALYYFVWGVITHVKTERISKKVVYEYLGVAMLAGFLLLLITF